MKGLCAHRTQKTGSVDISRTHGGLRWHGLAHGLFAADGRCVPFQLYIIKTGANSTQLSNCWTYRYQLFTYVP
jgi:hypothetical protein